MMIAVVNNGGFSGADLSDESYQRLVDKNPEVKEYRELLAQERRNPYLRHQDGDVWNPNYAHMFEGR